MQAPLRRGLLNGVTALELYREAIERYGEHRQLVKVCEELAELQQAICKRFDVSVGYERDGEEVVEEIADVEIMLEQLRVILRVDPEMEQRWRERKLNRLRRRLGV